MFASMASFKFMMHTYRMILHIWENEPFLYRNPQLFQQDNSWSHCEYILRSSYVWLRDYCYIIVDQKLMKYLMINKVHPEPSVAIESNYTDKARSKSPFY